MSAAGGGSMPGIELLVALIIIYSRLSIPDG